MNAVVQTPHLGHAAFSTLCEEDQARLARFLPLRVVIRRHADGSIEGLTEESWNMNWSDKRVNIFWSGKCYSMLGEGTLDAVADAQHNCKEVAVPDLFTAQEMVIDPLAQDSPIVIDWKRWLNASHKYDKRNAYFVLKGDTK